MSESNNAIQFVYQYFNNDINIYFKIKSNLQTASVKNCLPFSYNSLGIEQHKWR